MEKVCYSCKKKILIGSLKTSRTRFVQMGLIPPEGMSSIDKICTKCLQEIYEKQIKQSRIKKLKNSMAKDLLIHKNKDRSLMPKKILVEKKKKFLQ
jgi:hypothetical protein